jgi:hypothetical protein
MKHLGLVAIIILAGCVDRTTPVERGQKPSGSVTYTTGWTVGGGLVPGSISFVRSVTRDV